MKFSFRSFNEVFLVGSIVGKTESRNIDDVEVTTFNLRLKRVTVNYNGDVTKEKVEVLDIEVYCLRELGVFAREKIIESDMIEVEGMIKYRDFESSRKMVIKARRITVLKNEEELNGIEN